MSYNPSRYCYVLWESGRTLEARELLTLESIIKGVDSLGNPIAFDLNAIYNEGATFNVNPVISMTSGTASVQFTPVTSGQPMLIFARGRWWVFIAGETPSITLPSLTSNIYLNWWVVDVSNSTDASLTDASGNATADMGQLYLQLTTTNSLASVSPTPIDQNISPAIVFSFIASDVVSVLAPTNSNTGVNINVKKQALSTSSQAGPVYLTDNTQANITYPGVACYGNDPRLSDSRNVLTHAVVDKSVDPANLGSWAVTSPPTSESFSYTGDNYDNISGGINSSKVIYTAGLPSNTSTVATVDVLLANHLNTTLGNTNTHPLVVNSDSATFEIKHATVDTNGGDAFLVQGTGSPGTRLAALTQEGDVYSYQSSEVTPVVPRSGPYTSGTVDGSGCEGTLAGTATSVGNLSSIASLVSSHINQNVNSNPHGYPAITNLTGDVTASGPGSATTTLATVCSTPGSYVGANVTVNSKGLVTTATSGFTHSANGSGYWSKDPTGKYEMWGNVTSLDAVKGNFSFPATFTTFDSVTLSVLPYTQDGTHHAAEGFPVDVNTFYVCLYDLDNDAVAGTFGWIAVGY